MLSAQAGVEAIIDSCLEVRGARPGKLVKFEEQAIVSLCAQAKEVRPVQPSTSEY